MAYIYKITNDINDKMYVGKTYTTIEKRLKEHIRDSRKRRTENRPLYKAINKYGPEHFHIEQIEETDNPEEREMYWIEKLRTYVGFEDCNGYNATLGGDGKPYVDYDLIVTTYKELKSVNKVAKQLNNDIATIRRILRERNIEIPGDYEPKSVNQYDKYGCFIKRYSSIMEASREIIAKGLSNSVPQSVGRNISVCCHGRRKIAFGYQWQFAE